MLRVLVADDHRMFLAGLRRLLSEAPELTVCAEHTDGDAALAGIVSLQPDVAVLDIGMPGLGGLEVLAELRRRRLPTKVVVLTMRKCAAAAQWALRSGALGYVLKEDAFDDLTAAVRAAHGGRTHVSASVRRLLSEAGDDLPGRLSDRELEVLRFIAAGYSSREIAAALAVRPRTIETYRERVMQKLDLHKAADLVRYALGIGLVAE